MITYYDDIIIINYNYGNTIVYMITLHWIASSNLLLTQFLLNYNIFCICLSGCDRYSGPVPVPVDFSHSSTGSGPVPVKSKLLIPVPVKILMPVVSRFQSVQVFLYKALDILFDLLSRNFNPGRSGIIRTTEHSSRFHAYFVLLFVTSVD